MAFPPPKKKPAGPPAEDDFALLMGDEGGDDAALEEEDDFGEDPMGEDVGGMGEDPLDASGVDPEVAGLAERLGFSEPDQQQALVDLIKLVMGSSAPEEQESFEDPMAPMPAPESPY